MDGKQLEEFGAMKQKIDNLDVAITETKKEMKEGFADIKGQNNALYEKMDKALENTNCNAKEIQKTKTETARNYATNEKVDALKKELIKANEDQDRRNNNKWGWIANNWFNIVQTLIIIVIGFIAWKGGI